ncbi:hypothetical protein F5148DRAFT_1369901 [Russula earlei]|uniref:Uncharacterized protein n=1 Tax=Russula earlei TaxID=71964 RepID=A0ACC0U167_9AGAM|nr:hypothetical protein F5148DRAFT_1369901 [Russula earlei]
MNEASVSKETESERRGAEGSEPSGKATMTASMCGGAELRLEDRREWSVGGETVPGRRVGNARGVDDGREYNDADEGGRLVAQGMDVDKGQRRARLGRTAMMSCRRSMCGGAELRLEDQREWGVGGEAGDVDGDRLEPLSQFPGTEWGTRGG